MREFSQKRRMMKKIYSIPVLIFLLIILFFVLKGTWGIFKKSSFSEKQRIAVEAELIALQERKNSIEKKIQRLNTETGIEEEIRSKFDVAKEGERLIVIVDEEEKVLTDEKEGGAIDKFFTTIGSWFQ